MKKKIVVLLCVVMCLGLCACDADTINGAIDKAAEKLDEVEIKQEDLDKASEALGEASGALKEMLTDPDVQEAINSGINEVDEIFNKEEMPKE